MSISCLTLFSVYMQKILRFAQDSTDTLVILSGAKDLFRILFNYSMEPSPVKRTKGAARSLHGGLEGRRYRHLLIRRREIVPPAF